MIFRPSEVTTQFAASRPHVIFGARMKNSLFSFFFIIWPKFYENLGFFFSTSLLPDGSSSGIVRRLPALHEAGCHDGSAPQIYGR